jgi:hypothetical protein
LAEVAEIRGTLAKALVDIGMPAVTPLKALLEKDDKRSLALEVIRRILGDQLTTLSLSDRVFFNGVSDESLAKCREYLESVGRQSEKIPPPSVEQNSK